MADTKTDRSTDQHAHWLDAAAMLRKAARDLTIAHRLANVEPEDVRVQSMLKSALYNIAAATARFEHVIVR